jgi:hypothetical protein
MAPDSPPARPASHTNDPTLPRKPRQGTNPEGLEALWAELGWRPTDDQQIQFVQLQKQLRQWNEKVNLTRLVEGDDYWVAQVYDSLWPMVRLIRSEQARNHAAAGGEPVPPLEMIDVGTGGGFPGLALAIALPSARLTLVDSVGRKVEAVRAMVAALGLEERVHCVVNGSSARAARRIAEDGLTGPWPGQWREHRWWRNTWCRCCMRMAGPCSIEAGGVLQTSSLWREQPERSGQRWRRWNAPTSRPAGGCATR